MLFSFAGVEIPSFFPPLMAWVISAVHLNYTEIKFQVGEHGSYFIISEFIPELWNNTLKFHFLA